jgi:hypothetical protein
MCDNDREGDIEKTFVKTRLRLDYTEIFLYFTVLYRIISVYLGGKLQNYFCILNCYAIIMNTIISRRCSKKWRR